MVSMKESLGKYTGAFPDEVPGPEGSDTYSIEDPDTERARESLTHAITVAVIENTIEIPVMRNTDAQEIRNAASERANTYMQIVSDALESDDSDTDDAAPDDDLADTA